MIEADREPPDPHAAPTNAVSATSSGPNGRRLPTGSAGLDEILGGGLVPQRLYLVMGEPGTGKTTLGLQFLLDGLRRGERVLYVTLSESAEELRAVAHSHGWSLEGAELFEPAIGSEVSEPEEPYTLFHPAEVELAETTRTIFEAVERTNPSRVVFDSLAELRLLAHDPLRFRRQILALKRYFGMRGITVLMLDDRAGAAPGDLHPQTIAHGVVALEQIPLAYGTDHRRLRIVKMRGVAFREGYHDYRIETGGLRVFPRLALDPTPIAGPTSVLSGVAGLDELLGGGLDRGTSTLVMGPAGVGKSAFALHYCTLAASRGEKAAVLMFDESPRTMFARSRSIGMDVEPHVRAGRILLDVLDPAEISPGQVACCVQERVERDGATIVVIDSLNGYLNALSAERHLLVQLHALLGHLGSRGVLTIMIVAQHGLLGSHMESPVDISYVADTVVLLRYFEAGGAVRQAISVVKKRNGPHERTIREFSLGRGGLRVGQPLNEFAGVLTGVPAWRPRDGAPPPPLETPPDAAAPHVHAAADRGGA